jgi:uncharacterized protein YjhX (UPF0386 family)
MAAAESTDKERRRIVRHLLRGPAWLERSANPERPLLRLAQGGTVSVARAALEQMVQQKLLGRDGDMIALTQTGTALARRNEARIEPFREQHAELETRLVKTGETMVEALVNTGESPLSKLAQRRNRNGDPFLSPREFNAGERLRRDYTRGRIMPRLGANWGFVAAGRKQARGRGEAAELTDAALAARQRVELALDATGPELSGVLIDVCCFLKGLETVESERGWPVRSAKVVLKTALAVLARHYEPEPRTSRWPRVLHWGAEDYRPSLTG